MDNYKKLFMVITLSVGCVLFLYFNGTTVVHPHITKLHQYLYQLSNYSVLSVSNSNTDNLISFKSVKQDIPVKNKTIAMLNELNGLVQKNSNADNLISVESAKKVKNKTIVMLNTPNGPVQNIFNADNLISFQSVKQDIQVKNKTIVMLNTPKWLEQSLTTKHMFDECEVSACRFHYKQAFKYINDSDAVILYAVGFSSRNNFIRRPKQGQIWIFAVWEPPLFFSQQFAILKDKINWTMTYRLDSDIPVPYASFKKTSGLSKNFTKMMAEKTKLAAQVVSHCPTPSLRERYVESLQKYIPVMVYGRCGPTKKRSQDKHLFKKIEKSYKFYLAFENSLCRGYVTEKCFDWQNRNIVPIVRGDGDYERFYPKNSYIDVRDFKSISDLAKYVKYLDRNDTAYIEYLKAKENYVVTHDIGETVVKSFCQICKMVHNPDKYRNTYSNVQDWSTNGTCRKPTDLERRKKS